MSDDIEDTDHEHGRYRCTHTENGERCEGNVECNPHLYLSLWADGSWEIVGVADESAQIVCDYAGHDNYTEPLGKSLTAFLEHRFPGKTWEGSDPRHDMPDVLSVDDAMEAISEVLSRTDPDNNPSHTQSLQLIARICQATGRVV